MQPEVQPEDIEKRAPPIFSHADAPRLTDPLDPSGRNTIRGKVGSDRARQMWPAFTPVDAAPAERSAFSAESRNVDAQRREPLLAFVGNPEVLSILRHAPGCQKGIGERHTEMACEVVVASPAFP